MNDDDNIINGKYLETIFLMEMIDRIESAGYEIENIDNIPEYEIEKLLDNYIKSFINNPNRS